VEQGEQEQLIRNSHRVIIEVGSLLLLLCFSRHLSLSALLGCVQPPWPERATNVIVSRSQPCPSGLLDDRSSVQRAYASFQIVENGSSPSRAMLIWSSHVMIHACAGLALPLANKLFPLEECRPPFAICSSSFPFRSADSKGREQRSDGQVRQVAKPRLT
jgi:hypothetical protein